MRRDGGSARSVTETITQFLPLHKQAIKIVNDAISQQHRSDLLFKALFSLGLEMYHGKQERAAT